MYESPLNKIYKDITTQIIKQDEDNFMYAVNQAVEYTVDKQELIKALQYDRNQYEKGYADATKEYEDKVEQIRAEIKQLPYQRIFGNVSSYSLLDTVIEIVDKYRQEDK